ncbi:MAG: glycosyl transferase family 1 [Desulfobacterales bacterium S5133MH4]|nr:MAG: glycosyl transferase family 1 [Desulfobacterales bacterium S5133MH4]
MEHTNHQSKGNTRTRNIGFISTRLAGTDGVSLEAAKWADVFETEGFNCFSFAGELDRPPERSYLAEKAHFTHPEIEDIQRKCFGVTSRDRSTTIKIHEIKENLKDHIYSFIERYEIGLLIPENALTIPMNIPLGLAITETLIETGMSAIAHHHDFYWERDRFTINAAWDYLNMAFPPNLPSLDHRVINSFASEQLNLRTGISAKISPNIMDFENPPPPIDDYASDVRQALGIEDDEIFVLQPTRIVKRKGIEHAIELVHRLGMKAKLVISHSSGDEGYDYEQRLREYTKLMQVNTIFASDFVNEERRYNEDGSKVYTLSDIYPHADLVTYPSTFEGFGNAFLEAIYFRKPIVVNTYSIYTKDIKPKGFSVIELDGYVTQAAVDHAKEVLSNPELCRRMVDENYEIGKRFFSYAVLRGRIKSYVAEHPWLF